MDNTGHPVQLLTINEEDNSFCLNDIAREILLKHGDHTAVVISIAGALRTGKSFLLNFFLRYLNVKYKSSNSSEPSWMGREDVSLKGFKWKCTQDRVTTGMQMWSEPICTTLPSGEKVAIILLDTQGFFDGKTSFSIETKLFALSTMLASIQIYNLSKQIQEDNLQMLQFFTDYGKLATKFPGNTVIAPFQNLLFLVRDWCYAFESPFGYEGGNQVVDKILKTTDEQKEELKSVRMHIKSYFDVVKGFLMPNPGEEVSSNPYFDGQLSSISQPFKDSLKELIPSILAPEGLVLKKINGQTVTLFQLVEYLDQYVNTMNSKEMLNPKGIIDANAEVSHRQAFDFAIKVFIQRMQIVFDEAQPYVETTGLSEKDLDVALNCFESCPKLGDGNLRSKFIKMVREKCEKIYRSYANNNQTRKAVFDLKKSVQAKEQTIEEMKRVNDENLKIIDDLLKNETVSIEEIRKLEDQSLQNQQRIDEYMEKNKSDEEEILKLEKEIKDFQKKRFLLGVGLVALGAVACPALGIAALAAEGVIVTSTLASGAAIGLATALKGAFMIEEDTNQNRRIDEVGEEVTTENER